MAASEDPFKWIERIKNQGPWNQVVTPDMLRGPPALPMPVTIATPESLAPCFDHIRNNGRNTPIPGLTQSYELDDEPYHDVSYIEFEKGVIYADQRLDLCKIVLGPRNIDELLDSLEGNDFIRHFLLGNNIIGPAGCRRIARFLEQHPNRMDTWYLAGNCIDEAGFSLISDGLARSTATNIWLKRNPLGTQSSSSIAKLILRSKHLRTLDLDQTELGDDGVAEVFRTLVGEYSASISEDVAKDMQPPLPLQNLFLNGVGVGQQAAEWINMFLCGSQQVRSLYLSDNPLGDCGASSLTSCLSVSNTSLERLMLSSTGITSRGAIAILEALSGHPTLQTLHLGQSYATNDLGTHFNFLDDKCAPAVVRFILKTPSLRVLDLAYSNLSLSAINDIITAALRSISLCVLNLTTVDESGDGSNDKKLRSINKVLKQRLQKRLAANAYELYDGVKYDDFLNRELRWLKGPKEDLRKIDSVYRNRDVGLARRGLKILDKWWDQGDDTLNRVMNS